MADGHQSVLFQTADEIGIAPATTSGRDRVVVRLPARAGRGPGGSMVERVRGREGSSARRRVGMVVLLGLVAIGLPLASVVMGPLSLVDGQTRTVNAQLAPVSAAPVRDATITGVVTAPDGSPLAGIQVRLYVAGASTSCAATTDAQGRYTFTGKLPGDYQLYFRGLSSPWQSEWNGDAATQAEAQPIVITSGTNTVNATLAPR